MSMIENRRKIIATTLVWLMLMASLHTVMASVGSIHGDTQTAQSLVGGEHPAAHNPESGHEGTGLDMDHGIDKATHQAGKVNSKDHCQQQTDCNGCDACGHCLNLICGQAFFSAPTAQHLFSPHTQPSYQVDPSATFRPPRLS